MPTEKRTLTERVTELEGLMKNVAIKTEEMHRAVYGSNGDPGMLTEQSKLTEKMDDLKKMVWVVIGVAITIVAEGLYLVAQHIFAAG